jgi:hypothetical protein
MIVPRRGATIFLTPVPGVELFSLLSGGLRYASTTCYYRLVVLTLWDRSISTKLIYDHTP